MMQIARFRMEYGNEGKGEKSLLAKEDIVWDYISKNYEGWKSEDIKPLFLTHRGIYGGISLVVSSRSANAFAEYIIDNITSVGYIKDIWMFNMMEPRLFFVPKNLSQNMRRFTLTLNVVPREAPFVYEFISKIKPSSEVVITYIAYTYNKHGDMLISLLAADKMVVEDFERKYIGGMKGVIRTEIIPIIKSKNLATPKEWRDFCGKYFVIKDGKYLEDLDIYESWSKIGFE